MYVNLADWYVIITLLITHGYHGDPMSLRLQCNQTETDYFFPRKKAIDCLRNESGTVSLVSEINGHLFSKPVTPVRRANWF